MDAIEEIEKKLSNYEDHYISENKLLNRKINEYIEKEKKYKEQILSLYNQINELKIISSNHNKKAEFGSKLIKEENIQLKDEYNSIKNEYNKIKKELNSEKIKNEILIDKYNKLSYLYEQKEKENFKLMEKIDDKKQIIDINNDNTLEKEKNQILSYCNNTLSIFIKWMETNFISLNANNKFNDDNNLYDNNNYNDLIVIEKNNLFVFDKLRESLLKAKNIIDSNYTKINMELEEEKQKIKNMKKNFHEYNTLLVDIYNHLYQEIMNGKYFDINYNKSINNNKNDLNICYYEIEKLINKIFELLKKIKDSSYDKSLDKLIEDNTQLTKEIENLKSKTIALYNDSKILFKYKNELEKINEELKQQLSYSPSDEIQN